MSSRHSDTRRRNKDGGSMSTEGLFSFGGWRHFSGSNERLPLVPEGDERSQELSLSSAGGGGGGGGGGGLDSGRGVVDHQGRRRSILSLLSSPANNELLRRRGLSAKYVNWVESTTAFKYALANFIAYQVVAVIGYSFVFEDWPIYDSIYFAMVVFTTVGYGDLSPSSSLSRAFTVCFALYGIIILGIFLGVVGQFIIERNDENMKERLTSAKDKFLQQFGTDPVTLRLEEKKRSLTKEISMIVLAETPIILGLIALGSPIIFLEDWDLDKGIYWMVVTGTSIGFGDLEPTMMITRILCIFWIPLAVAVMGQLLGRIAGAFIERNNDVAEEQFLQRAMTLADLDAMDDNGDSKVSPDEFLRYMLVALQRVEKEDIDDIMAIFQKIDRDGSGLIEKSDLHANFMVGRMTRLCKSMR